MSSITRIMLGLPQLPTDKIKTKKIGNIIFTRVTKQNGDREISIIKETENGRKLLKSILQDDRGSDIFKHGKYHVYYDKRSGRIFDRNA